MVVCEFETPLHILLYVREPPTGMRYPGVRVKINFFPLVYSLETNPTDHRPLTQLLAKSQKLAHIIYTNLCPHPRLMEHACPENLLSRCSLAQGFCCQAARSLARLAWASISRAEHGGLVNNSNGTYSMLSVISYTSLPRPKIHCGRLLGR